jgi:hypothetical protein
MSAILSRTLGHSDDLRMLFVEGDEASLTSLMAMPPASRTVLPDLACAHHSPPVTPFDHVHGFDSREFSLPRLWQFEPRHEAYHPFDGLLVLFNDIIEILNLASLNTSLVLLVRALARNGVGPACMDGKLLGDTVPADGLL